MFTTESITIDVILRALLLGPVAVLWAVSIVKVIGLRTFSKMTAFDFVVTLASASLLAAAAGSPQWSAYFQNLLAMTAILFFQAGLTFLRNHSQKFKNLIENEPLLLLHNGAWQESNLKLSRVAKVDLIAKMRQAGIHDESDVAAVILETTGDVSILTGPSHPNILQGVRKLT